LQLAQAGARKPVEPQHQRFDTLIVARRANRIDDVAQQRFLQLEALCLGERTLERVAGKLIDECALRRDDERRGGGHRNALTGETRHQDEKKADQEHEVQHAPNSIERAPYGAQQTYGKGFAAHFQ
jgi:hypothetical protein